MRAALIALPLAVACRGAAHPHLPTQTASFAVEVSQPGQTLRGVAGDGARVVIARAAATTSEVEARAVSGSPVGGAIAWHVTLPGSAGPIAMRSDAIVVALAVTGTIDNAALGAKLVLHGEPSAVIVALDPVTGAPHWRAPIDATEYALVTTIASSDGPLGGVIVGGSFSGTLRIGDVATTPTASGTVRTVVSSAGRSDGFVASFTASGNLRWLVRLGGAGADAVTGVAARGDRVAIAGTFTGGADLLGEPLPAVDERLPFADDFVAELDATAGTRRWSHTFGGKGDDAVAGVAIDAHDRVAVAVTFRDAIRLGDHDLSARGAADGLVAWFSPTGEPGALAVLGGTEFDGLRAITAVGDRVIVAGFFHGTIALGKRALDSNGSDDGFLAEVMASGSVETSWHLGGPGREEVTALSSVPGGFVAGIAHTAALAIDDATLPAPTDPASGAAILGFPAP